MSVDTGLVCPHCHEDLIDVENLQLFDVIDCDECGVELEVVHDDPVTFKVLENAGDSDVDEYDESSDEHGDDENEEEEEEL